MTAGVLETPSMLNNDAKNKIKSEWASLYGGSHNAGSIAVLDAGFNYKPITIPLKDIEFIASRKMNKAEIATIFDVPLYMLNDLDNAKFNFVKPKINKAKITLAAQAIPICGVPPQPCSYI